MRGLNDVFAQTFPTSSWNRFRNSNIVKLNNKVVSETKIARFYHLQFENLFHIYNLICDSNILNEGSKLFSRFCLLR